MKSSLCLLLCSLLLCQSSVLAQEPEEISNNGAEFPSGITCANIRCRSGYLCRDARCLKKCCNATSCDNNDVCFNGLCTKPWSCEINGCPEGWTCRSGECKRPVLTCATINCLTGYKCVNNRCIPNEDPITTPKNLCITVKCIAGQYCEPSTGHCLPLGTTVDTVCSKITCPVDQICLEATGKCEQIFTHPIFTTEPSS